MGYRAEKEEIEKKDRKIKFVVFAIVMVILASLCVFSAFVPPEEWKYYVALPNLSKRTEGELRIHFLDVGQADSTLIEFPDGQTLLLDGGDVDADEKILRYLNALKIETLDYILLTHGDIDHCGSLQKVFERKTVKKVFTPYVSTDELTGTSAFVNFLTAIENSSAEVEVAKRFSKIESIDERYPFTFSILFPYSGESGGNENFDENELSTICWLDYMGKSTLFCGDTNADILQKLVFENELGEFNKMGVDLASTEILKVPHHGGNDGLYEEFFDFVSVETAVISCGKNNPYGHPASGTLKFLRDSNVEVYRTDWHGDVVVRVDKNAQIQIEHKKRN